MSTGVAMVIRVITREDATPENNLFSIKPPFQVGVPDRITAKDRSYTVRAALRTFRS